MSENFVFAIWLKRHRSLAHAEIINKLDGIFNQRYPVYHLKENVIKFTRTIQSVLKRIRKGFKKRKILT